MANTVEVETTALPVEITLDIINFPDHVLEEPETQVTLKELNTAGIADIITLTQKQYDALEVKVEDHLYLILPK